MTVGETLHKVYKSARKAIKSNYSLAKDKLASVIGFRLRFAINDKDSIITSNSSLQVAENQVYYVCVSLVDLVGERKDWKYALTIGNTVVINKGKYMTLLCTSVVYK
jgi:hypothetical protein